MESRCHAQHPEQRLWLRKRLFLPGGCCGCGPGVHAEQTPRRHPLAKWPQPRAAAAENLRSVTAGSLPSRSGCCLCSRLFSRPGRPSRSFSGDPGDLQTAPQTSPTATGSLTLPCDAAIAPPPRSWSDHLGAGPFISGSLLSEGGDGPFLDGRVSAEHQAQVCRRLGPDEWS